MILLLLKFLILFVFSCNNIRETKFMRLKDKDIMINYTDIRDSEKTKTVICKICDHLNNEYFYRKNYLIKGKILNFNKKIILVPKKIRNFIIVLYGILNEQFYQSSEYYIFKKKCKLYLNLDKLLNKNIYFDEVLKSLDDGGKNINLNKIIDEENILDYSKKIKNILIDLIPDKHELLIKRFLRRNNIKNLPKCLLNVIVQYCEQWEKELELNIKYDNIPKLKLLIKNRNIDEKKKQNLLEPEINIYKCLQRGNYDSAIFYYIYLKSEIHFKVVNSNFFNFFFPIYSFRKKIVKCYDTNFENKKKALTFILNNLPKNEIKEDAEDYEEYFKNFDYCVYSGQTLLADYQIKIIDELTKIIYKHIKPYVKSDYLDKSLEDRIKSIKLNYILKSFIVIIVLFLFIYFFLNNIQKITFSMKI